MKGYKEVKQRGKLEKVIFFLLALTFTFAIIRPKVHLQVRELITIRELPYTASSLFGQVYEVYTEYSLSIFGFKQ